MTDYFVSTAGSDSNNGLGPDASAATNKPYLTLGKAMNTGAVVVPGDRIICGPGNFLNSPLTPIAAISSVASPTQIIADRLNAFGFKDGSGVRLAAAPVLVSTRTSANGMNGTLSSATSLIRADTNAPKGLQWKWFVLECRNDAFIWQQNMGGSTDTLFEDCLLVGRVASFSGGTPTAGMNLTFRRCEGTGVVFLTCSNAVAAATANANLGVLVEETLYFGSIAVSMALSASGGNLAGGILLYDNTWIPTQTNVLTTVASRVSTVTPIRIGSHIVFGGGSGGMNAGTSGQIIDDGYCLEGPGVSRTNITNATGTLIGSIPFFHMHLPWWVRSGLQMPSEDFLGWTRAAHADFRFSASGRTTSDIRGRTVRPWGAGSSIGAWQSPDEAQDATSAISVGGTYSHKITGAGEPRRRFFAPVTSGVATTFSIYTKSASYGGTNWPQLTVVANPDVGLTSDQTATATSASEQQLTTPSFTPTANGVVELRMVSRSSSGSSSTYFDKITKP